MTKTKKYIIYILTSIFLVAIGRWVGHYIAPGIVKGNSIINATGATSENAKWILMNTL